MVGKMMAAIPRGRITNRINAVKFGDASDIASKLNQLSRLREELSSADPSLFTEFLPPLLDLLSDRASPVRRVVTEMLSEIGLKHLDFLPEIIPALINVLKDDSPAVARQAIKCGIDIFRRTLIKVAKQGLFSSEFDELLKYSWECAVKFRDEMFSVAFEAGSDGRRLPALKFVESTILLYTPDPNGSLEPLNQVSEAEFNISWLSGRHPMLNVGDMSVEASKSLDQLLDQLRLPTVTSISNLTIIVLIKILSGIANKRPSFYGRILPVLLGLDPLMSSNKGFHLPGLHHALKNAFEFCLTCTHPGAMPWKDRILNALKEIKLGRPSEQVWDIMPEKNETNRRDDSHISQIQSNVGRKRNEMQDSSDLTNEEPGKRVKSMPDALEKADNDPRGTVVKVPLSSEPSSSKSETDSGPVQQLVAMFGALVAQGEKAAASLEILISSISADLLAEVVMANIRNLPPKYPKSEVDMDSHLDIGPYVGVVATNEHIKHLSSLLTEILSQPSSSPQEVKTEALHHSDSSELEMQRIQGEEQHLALGVINVGYESSHFSCHQEVVSTSESDSHKDIPPIMETGFSNVKSEVKDVAMVEEEIPGLCLATQGDRFPEVGVALSIDSADVEDSDREKVINLAISPRDLGHLAQSFLTDRSEELSPKAAVLDASNINSSAPITDEVISQLVLPRISAPVISLTDELKDQLQELAYMRIVDAYRQVSASGGGQVRFSILAHSGIEFPSELDPWKLLKMHLLSDYVNHEGHEITLRVLYRLFGEAEEDHDFFSATTATSVYETFLFHVSEMLRDSFSASDKSLSRLLNEVPYIPKSIFTMLESLCSPGCNANDDKELLGGDRVTQGLSIIWSLILLRPPIREASLKIALKSTVHHLEEVRMKAIRLVANKLYPLPFISEKIEQFAKEMLLSATNESQTTVTTEADGPDTQLRKDDKCSTENQLGRGHVNDIAMDTQHLAASGTTPNPAVVEAQRCMSLYFALCTKKHTLFRLVFDVYISMSEVAKQAVHYQLPLLVRTIGSSRGLLDIMSDSPSGSEELLMQVVKTLTDGTIPSPELLSTIRRLYETKIKDMDILIPILSYMPKEEVLRVFPYIVNAPLNKFQVALSRVIQGSNPTGPVLTPAEALIAIHGIDPERDGIPLKKVTEACNVCFDQQEIFTQPVLAKVLNQLVEQIPLPLLFMRTVLQAIGAFPSLVDFIMDILSRLVNKQIWKYPKLWVGFVKCALLTKPQSFGVLLQLPPAQLENALNRTPALKSPLVAHANQQHIRSSLPRSTLAVLGIATDVQVSSLTKPAQSQTEETVNTDKEEVTDKSKESSTVS